MRMIKKFDSKAGTLSGRKSILKEAEDAFYRAMLVSYAGGGDDDGTIEFTSEKSAGWTKNTMVVDGKYTVVDRWKTDRKTGNVKGKTTVLIRLMLEWFQVWEMSYKGNFPEETIPFLKEVLLTSYTDGEFHGCRGRINGVSHTEFTYQNEWEGNFARFNGREDIFSIDGEGLGHHIYSGKTHLQISS